jgi:hypothetical protein
MTRSHLIRFLSHSVVDQSAHRRPGGSRSVTEVSPGSLDSAARVNTRSHLLEGCPDQARPLDALVADGQRDGDWGTEGPGFESRQPDPKVQVRRLGASEEPGDPRDVSRKCHRAAVPRQQCQDLVHGMMASPQPPSPPGADSPRQYRACSGAVVCHSKSTSTAQDLARQIRYLRRSRTPEPSGAARARRTRTAPDGQARAAESAQGTEGDIVDSRSMAEVAASPGE